MSIILEIPETGARKESYELAGAVADVGRLISDDIPDRTQLDKYFKEVVDIVQEGADLASIPKGEKLKAVGLAFSIAGAMITDEALTFADELTDEVPGPSPTEEVKEE